MSRLRLWTIAQIAEAAFMPAPGRSEDRVRREMQEHREEYLADARAHRAR